ncbi:hypothetical protein L7F22_001676 [Adiantum nelumboides]|nr:hypothetical protein [Adiantum nelumboides]
MSIDVYGRYEEEEQEMLEEPFTKMMEGILQLPRKSPGTCYSLAIAAANILRSQFQLWIDERRHNLALGKGSDDVDVLSCLLTYVDENAILVYQLNTSQCKYFEVPDRSDPSRFEGAGPAPYTFVPFGGGARNFLRNEFAWMEALVLLHHLVIRFSWTLVDPHEVITVDPMPCPRKDLPVKIFPCNC